MAPGRLGDLAAEAFQGPLQAQSTTILRGGGDQRAPRGQDPQRLGDHVARLDSPGRDQQRHFIQRRIGDLSHIVGARNEG